MFDRGILSINQVMDIWNMAHVDDGDKRYIRREYVDINELGGEENAESNNEGIQEPATTTASE